MKKLRMIFFVSAAGLILCWLIMAGTDFVLAWQAKAPIFSIYDEVTDADRYRGLGYTIYIKYRGVTGMPGEDPKGYFYWGW